MNCIYCKGETKIINTRMTEGGNKKRRRRECLECKKRYTTYEILESIVNKKEDDIRDIVKKALKDLDNDINKTIKKAESTEIDYTCPNCNNDVSTEWDKLKLKEDIKDHNELIEDCPICDKTNIIKITVEVERG